MKIFKFFMRFFFILLGIFILINLIGMIYAYCTPKIDIKSANSFYLYDKDDKLLIEGAKANEWVNINDINPMIIKATLSIEDKNFYKHNGFDYLRIIKALFVNAKTGDIVQGASTITQQYAKNLFLDFEKSWKRKWKEMWITFRLEARYSKDEILEGYLNTINYGDATYGILNASKYYFNKELNDLSLAEIAILVGIPNSPANFSPINNLELSKERQKVVLDRMVKNGYITKEQADKAYNEEINLYGKKDSYELSSIMYYKDAVMKELYSISSIPKSYLESGGLKIFTSLDVSAQKILENSSKINAVDEQAQTSKVMINPNNGEVIALIGGVNYRQSQFNRAISSLRQPGSSLKPFLYYAALDNGFTASSKFKSEKTTFYFENGKTYSPQNAGNIYANKDITLASAIASSDNIFAVKTNLFLGEELMVNILKKVGITANLSASPSLALGTYEVNIMEMAQAYSVLANGGKKVNSHMIRKVMDTDGNVLYNYNEKEEQILDSNLTFIISELLTTTYDTSMIDYAYPTCINMLSYITHKYAIKSGSTDNDAWIAGYTPEVVLISWAGYDDNSKVSNNLVNSNKIAWITAMEDYFKNNKSSWYEMPKGVVGSLVNPITGEIAKTNDEPKRILYYVRGTEPN